MPCEVSLKLFDCLKRWEGVQRTVYRDAVGLPTVGVGHLVTPHDDLRVGQTISDARIADFLSIDVQTVQHAMNALITAPLTENQCIALTSLCFNIGRRAFAQSHLLYLLNEGAPRKAADEFPKFCKGGRPLRVIPGLQKRRNEERELFLTGLAESQRR